MKSYIKSVQSEVIETPRQSRRLPPTQTIS